jgi:hypothetical protein
MCSSTDNYAIFASRILTVIDITHGLFASEIHGCFAILFSSPICQSISYKNELFSPENSTLATKNVNV